MAAWASRLVTMSILGGQINTTQPIYVAGWPLNQLTIVCGQIAKKREVVLLNAAVYSLFNKLSVINYIKSNIHYTENF